MNHFHSSQSLLLSYSLVMESIITDFVDTKVDLFVYLPKKTALLLHLHC